MTEREIEQVKMLERMVIKKRGWNAVEAMREQNRVHVTDDYNRLPFSYLESLRRSMS